MPPKRKRTADAGPGRPSPHRPEQTNLGQQDRNTGGRGGRNTRRNDRQPSQSSQGASTTSNTSQPPSPTSQRTPATSMPSPIKTAASTTMAPPPLPPSPKVDPPYYLYEVITDARLAVWTQSGRQEVIDHVIQARTDEDGVEIGTIVQELANSVTYSRLDPAEAGSIVRAMTDDREKDAPADGFSFDTRIIFLNIMSVVVEIMKLPVDRQLISFMVYSDISQDLMRKWLDNDFLTKLGMVRDTYSRMVIRQNTNLLYRQQSYNLLREESEGFAKLVVELYNCAAASGNDPSFELASATFEKIKSLIGTFDVDPGRVLDISLDVFAATLVKQLRFWVRYVRISSFWPKSPRLAANDIFVGGLPRWAEPQLACETMNEGPDDDPDADKRRSRDVAFWEQARTTGLDAYYLLGGREVADAELARIAELDDDAQDDDEVRWIRTTKTVKPPGNNTAAQILGFKLRYYSCDLPIIGEVLPANLLQMAALLIKIGFISLMDLYPHLYPFDKDMEDLREKRMTEVAEKEKAARPGATSNALMNAGALSDEAVPGVAAPARRDANTDKATDTKATDKKKAAAEPAEPLDQKIVLLQSLLTIGALPESLFMLGRFPWLVEAYPDTLLPLVHRILLHSISKIAKETQATAPGESGCPAKKLADLDQSGVAKGSVKVSELQSRRALRWPYADKNHVDGHDYRFYFEEWADNVPVCQTVDDLFTLCSTFLNVSGVNIGRDPELLQSLCKIGLKNLRDDASQSNRDRWQDLLKRLLVPALSMTEGNPACIEAVWKLLKQYPIPIRYNIYAEWYEGTVSRIPAIKAAFNRTRLDTLGTMKRLSLTNINEMARQLGKNSHSSPGVVFKVALDQIESYNNLIQVFVECAKLFTDLSYDILVWSLLSSLGGKQRSRTQKQSVLLTSKWLQALSKLSGSVFKRYANMNSLPVLRYVNDQLLKGSSTDLVILKEFIGSMGGLVSNVDFTDAQIDAMTGGEALRRQTLINLQDKRFESTKSARRLMQALIDGKLVGELVINMAQYRQLAIYKVPEDEAHIKYLSATIDDTHQILVQTLDFLQSNILPARHSTLIPGISQLLTEFGLEPNLAFMIGRYVLAHDLKNAKPAAITASSESPKQNSPPQRPVDADGDVSMNSTKETPVEAEADKMQLDSKDETAVAIPSTSSTNGRKNDHLLDVLQPIIDSVQAKLPTYIWQFITPEFFVFFWTFELGDLAVPRSRYEQEHVRLQAQAQDVMKDRSDMSRAGMNRKTAKRDALQATAKKIRDEMLSHAEANQKTKLRIMKHAHSWFPASQTDANAICDMLLEQCILPRVCLSAADADYCFRMLKFMQDNRVANFKLMVFYERFFNSNRLRQMMFTQTVREAEYLGRFIKSMLGELSRWHRDKGIYEKEALGQNKEGRRVSLGFAKSLDSDGKPQDFVEHPEFRSMLYNWHRSFFVALKACLTQMEWMHIRNALAILKIVMEFFPAINFMGDQLKAALDVIKEREAPSKTASESEPGHRVDLSVVAQTTWVELQKRQKKLVAPPAFRPGADLTDKLAEETKKVASTATPQPSDTASQSRQSGNAPTAPRVEAEDGELKDAQSAKKQEATRPQAAVPAKPKDPFKKEPTAQAPASLPQPPTVPQKPAAKPATPKPTHALPASNAKADTPKSSTLTSAPPPPGLPSRPDVPVPGHRRARDLPPREPQDTREPRDRPREPRDYRERDYQERDSRDPRDSVRTPDNSRLERPARDFTGSDRRHEPNARDSGRGSERDWSGRPRNDTEREPRPPRDRGTPSDRGHDNRPLRDLPRDSSTPVAPSAPARDAPSSNVNPARAHLFAADKPEMINPDRAALLADTRASNNDRPSNRTQSPRRNQSPRDSSRRNADGPVNDRDRDDRHGRGPQTEPRPAHGRDRHSEREDRSREAFHPTGGRHSGHDARNQDPNYGRLNAAHSTPDIPSGPRGRGGPSNRDAGRGSTAPNGPSNRTDSRFPEPQRAPSPDRQVPTGPSSSRQPSRRGRGAQADNAPPPPPATPAQPSPATGVHPDRMRQIDPDRSRQINTSMAAPPAPASQPPQNAAPANAPSRPGRHGQNANQHQPGPKPSGPPLNTSDHAPPSAPTGPHSSRVSSGSHPNTPGSDPRNSHAAPTGPASSADRRGARMFKGIQDIVTNAAGGGSGSRRAATRQLSGSDAQILAGGSPVTTPIQERVNPMQRDPGSDRPGSSRGNGPAPARDGRNGDENTPGSVRDSERSSRREHRSDRSGRQSSRRSSRERDRERERSPAREREKGHRDYRDRRDAPPPPPIHAGGRDSDRRSLRGGEPQSANPNDVPLGGPSREPPRGDPNREPLGRGETHGRDHNRGDPNREPLGRDPNREPLGRGEPHGRDPNREPLGRDPNREPLGRGEPHGRDPNREPLGPGRDSRHRGEDYGASRGNRNPRDSGGLRDAPRDTGNRDSGRPDDRRDSRDDRNNNSRKRRSEGEPGGNDREKRPRR